MGIQFKNFCDKQPKLRNGHVRDLLDMTTEEKDTAVVAMLKDLGTIAYALVYPSMPEEDKNEAYTSVELVMQQCIEKYNEGVDLDKGLATPWEGNPSNIYRDWDDSGHGRGDFC